MSREFSDAVKARREELAWSQAYLGAKCGVSRVQISRIESGERSPSVELATAIATELDIDLNLLKAVVAEAATEPLENQHSQCLDTP